MHMQHSSGDRPTINRSIHSTPSASADICVGAKTLWFATTNLYNDIRYIFCNQCSIAPNHPQSSNLSWTSLRPQLRNNFRADHWWVALYINPTSQSIQTQLICICSRNWAELILSIFQPRNKKEKQCQKWRNRSNFGIKELIALRCQHYLPSRALSL